MTTFTCQTSIKLRDTDAAGVLFFANYFALAHDAYEAFMDGQGINFGREIREGGYIIPVVHAESDYRVPLWAGEAVTITVTVEKVRRRKFTLAYVFHNAEGRRACSLRTTHVVVNQKTGKSVPLPANVARALGAGQGEDAPTQ